MAMLSKVYSVLAISSAVCFSDAVTKHMRIQKRSPRVPIPRAITLLVPLYRALCR